MHTLKSIAVIVCIILLLVTVILAGVNAVFRLIYRDFYKNAERDFLIPGLNSGFVPQGFDDLGGEMLVSGYMKNGKSSRIYVLSSEGKKKDTVELYYEDGKPYTTHSGGVDVAGDFVYVSGDAYVEIFSLADILDDDGRASVKAVFDPGFDTAWCTVMNGFVLMGSFADEGTEKYFPDEGEIFTTPTGEKNVSLIKVFKIDENYPLGINPDAVAAFSSGEKVQGLAFVDEEHVILSKSYGLASSTLDFHKIDTERRGTFLDGEREIPLFYFDSATLERSVKAPPMSEELIVRDGYVYIMNESACNKYIFGKFIGQYRCHKYKI